MAQSFENILDMAEENGIAMKLISGIVEMGEDGLEEVDRKQNKILLCVSIPETDIILEA